MPSTKVLREKIRSLKNTRKITSAMKLVSSAKLKKSQDAFNRSREYYQSIQEATTRLLQSGEPLPLEFLRKSTLRHVTVLFLSTDKGLCGSFNSNLARAAQLRVQEHLGLQIDFVVLGRKGSEQLARRCPQAHIETHPAPPAKVPYSLIPELANDLSSRFLSKQTDRIYLAYNKFNSMVSQEPCLEQLLPLEPNETSVQKTTDILLEPDPASVYKTLFSQLVRARIHSAMQGSALG